MIKRFIRKHGARKLVCSLFDILSFLVGASFALLISGSGGAFSEYSDRIIVFSLSIVITFFSFRYHNLYKLKVIYSNLRQFVLLLKNGIFTFLSVLVLYFLLNPNGGFVHYRFHVIAFVFISYGLVTLNRFVFFRSIFRKFVPSSRALKNVVAVGAGRTGASTARKIKNNRGLGYNLVGFVDDKKDLQNKRIENVRVLGTTNDLPEIVTRLDVDEVFITVNSLNHQNLFDLIEKCKTVRCPIQVVSGHFDVIEKRIEQSEYDELRFVSLSSRENEFYRYTLKPFIDTVLAIVLLILLSPLFLLVILLIKLDSKGPVFYVPYSIGKDGKAFRFFKFRSMYHNASDTAHRKLIEEFISGKKKDGSKLQGDQRITRVGAFLRKHSIDELAQLINVVKGDMSLVGPRPSTIYEYEMMEDWHKKRYNAWPGMSGLWQVSGRSEVSFTEMVMMDIYYVENCSFWLDLVILMKTVNVVFFGKGGH